MLPQAWVCILRLVEMVAQEAHEGHIPKPS